MPRWLSRVLARVRKQACGGDIRFTAKAEQEILGLGLSPSDARDILTRLASIDSAGRLLSQLTGEWMYVFKTRVDQHHIYIKLVLRQASLVVSFHEDDEAEYE